MTKHSQGTRPARSDWLRTGVPIVVRLDDAARRLGVEVGVLEGIVASGQVGEWGRDASGRVVFRLRELCQAAGTPLPGVPSGPRPGQGRPKSRTS